MMAARQVGQAYFHQLPPAVRHGVAEEAASGWKRVASKFGFDASTIKNSASSLEQTVDDFSLNLFDRVAKRNALCAEVADVLRSCGLDKAATLVHDAAQLLTTEAPAPVLPVQAEQMEVANRIGQIVPSSAGSNKRARRTTVAPSASSTLAARHRTTLGDWSPERLALLAAYIVPYWRRIADHFGIDEWDVLRDANVPKDDLAYANEVARLLHERAASVTQLYNRVKDLAGGRAVERLQDSTPPDESDTMTLKMLAKYFFLLVLFPTPDFPAVEAISSKGNIKRIVELATHPIPGVSLLCLQSTRLPSLTLQNDYVALVAASARVHVFFEDLCPYYVLARKDADTRHVCTYFQV
eukprot:TRINITY_DN1246_c0_g2_i2.p1 TRINITY_DN1246_c0_g2~~TRINITY_DN1246_c0_g2_i2.p1  ORF type:complete len:354 (+),score=54.15 TRINITY_DN1246_c0_g2_i2:480-1541(+)